MSEQMAGRSLDGQKVGFFTDTSVCIGCKACEVACKQWNQLPDDGFVFTGMSYDNTGHLGAATWRHVAFVERPQPLQQQEPGVGEFRAEAPSAGARAEGLSWLFSSDVCKHCSSAGCLENCPTGSIIRTEHDTVYVQPDICNGCGYCVAGCPFGVIDRREDDGRAFKCTLCYDRLQDDMTPACAKACPTDSIVFGPLEEIQAKAQERVQKLHARGQTDAYLYGAGADGQPGTDGLNCFFLLMDEPEAYNLPPDPVAPSKRAPEAWRSMGAACLGMAAVTAVAAIFGSRGA